MKIKLCNIILLVITIVLAHMATPLCTEAWLLTLFAGLLSVALLVLTDIISKEEIEREERGWYCSPSITPAIPFSVLFSITTVLQSGIVILLFPMDLRALAIAIVILPNLLILTRLVIWIKEKIWA